MAEVGRYNQAYVLEVIRQKIIDSHSNFTETNVWIDDAPLPVARPDRYLSVTICCEMSQFEDTAQGPCDVIERGRFYITPIFAYQGGPTGQLTNLLIGTQDTSMIRVLKPAILRAMLVDVVSGEDRPWMPLGPDGKLLFVNNVKVLSCVGPKQYEQWPATYMPIVFEVSWVWKL